MKSSIEFRGATAGDALRISALLTALAAEFILREFTTEGRLHLLAHFGVTEMEERLEATNCDGIGNLSRHRRARRARLRTSRVNAT